MTHKILKQITDRIKQSQRIVLTSHLRPDGDSLCTSLALYHTCRSLGKNVEIINKDKTPFPFNLFPEMELINIGSIPDGKFDLAILLECANVSRSGQEALNGLFKINIDHHHSNDYYADINWVDPEAAAVACMAYDLIKAFPSPLTPKIAENLFCGIVSDTGSFQFSNTVARAFEVSAHLINAGADPVKINELLYNNNSPEKIRLFSRVLSTLKMYDANRIAVVSMYTRDLEELNLPKQIDSEFITTMVRSIKDTQIVLFFKEMKKNTFRVSLRSRGNANSARIAEHFGGGGHLHAAGFTVEGNYQSLVTHVANKVADLLENA